MAQPNRKPAILGDVPVEIVSTPWSQTPGMEIAGRAYLDEADLTAVEMERKWGAGRLRLLVGPELREKFDRQRYLLNQAIWHGDLEAVRREAQRMVKAWMALDRTAIAAGKGALSPEVWEVALDDGSVAAIVPDTAAAGGVQADGRKLAVYTLDEIARLLVGFPGLARAKETFPGASVERVTRTIGDPLDGIVDSDAPLDDEIPF
jgi:hypothetical protein